jgi:hypothetical protein
MPAGDTVSNYDYTGLGGFKHSNLDDYTHAVIFGTKDSPSFIGVPPHSVLTITPDISSPNGFRPTIETHRIPHPTVRPVDMEQLVAQNKTNNQKKIHTYDHSLDYDVKTGQNAEQPG